MSNDGLTSDALCKINPTSIEAYLSSRGWHKDQEIFGFHSFSNDGYGMQLMVPTDRTQDDYPRRLYELISDLSEIYSESAQSILTGMSMSSCSDTVEYHYESNPDEVGIIPVDSLVSILRAGRNINTYALRDLIQYEPYYRGSGWNREELDRIRIGPPIPGSYIVQFLYPTGTGHADGADGSALDLKVLCDKIEDSVISIKDAAERGRKSLDPELRISYNFVSSVMSLGSSGSDIGISRTRPGEPERQNPPTVLTEKIFRNISSIESEMRPPELSEEGRFVGRIVQINDRREECGDQKTTMKLRFLDSEGRKAVTARFDVSGEDAETAYNASKDRKIVSIEGILSGPPGSRRIDDITDFRVLDRCPSDDKPNNGLRS